MKGALRVAWYRFCVTFARRRGGYLAIVLLVGLLGGLAMGAIAGARRTQSSFPAYLASVNASDLTIGTALFDPQIPGFTRSYDAGIIARIARLPHVQQVGNFTGVDPNLTPPRPRDLHLRPGESPPEVGGSLDGEFSTLDRVKVVSGRLADPKRRGEIVMAANAARQLGMHIGSVLPMDFCSNAQLIANTCSATGKGTLAPPVKVDLELVGIVAFDSTIVEDEVDALGNNPVILTPALTRELVQCCSFYTYTAIKVDGGNRNVGAVQAEIARSVPKLKAIASFSNPSLTSNAVATAERAIGPESIALGAFGAIALLAALLIAGQLVGRQIRLGSDERSVLRALGASPATMIADGLLGAIGAIVLGALIAALAAVALSPLSPLGPVRRVEHRSINFDWTVLGLGFAGLVVALSGVALAIAYRQAPQRVARRSGHTRVRSSRAARQAANAGLRAPAVTGIRFALEPGSGTNAVPVRSAIVGAILALVVMTSALTFGTSLRTLVSHPALYGWNWDYQFLSGFAGAENLPQQQVATLLDHDKYVTAWSGIYFGGGSVDGHPVATIGESPGASVAPPVLSGHGLDAPDQIVLGEATLAMLHKHLGDTVQVEAAQPKPLTLRIVGTATMPTIGTGGLHSTMGTGALIDYRIIPAKARNIQGSPVAGPQAILIRVRKGSNPTAVRSSLRQINDTINTPKGGGGDEAGGFTGVMHPAEILNYRSMGNTPALLGGALAVGAIAALALTLIASVRRRRRELALLKTLGFRRRQLAAVVAWQSTIAVGIGVIIGIPLGIIAGRALWDLFARQIHAVPQPTVPALTIILIAFGALVVANLVAAIPGRQAARTQIAVLLREE